MLGCAAALAAPGEGPVEPQGLWSCLVYGDPVRGEHRVALMLAEDGRSFWSMQALNSMAEWRQIGDWNTRRRQLSFVDPRTRREFLADLDRKSLGGEWRDGQRSGGWWCARRPEEVALGAAGLTRSNQEFFVPPLVPDRMDSPRYPRQAIRNAKEGRAVVCFVVDPGGTVHEPEIIELSDEVFEAPTLAAIEGSHYRPSTRELLVRPGCRQFTYELDQVR